MPLPQAKSLGFTMYIGEGYDFFTNFFYSIMSYLSFMIW